MVQIMGCRRAGDNLLFEPTMAQFTDAYIMYCGLDELRDGDRGDHPGDIYVSVIISLLYSYLLYTVFRNISLIVDLCAYLLLLLSL